MNPCRKPGARSWHRRTADRILVCVQTSLDQPTLHPIQGLKRRGGRGDRRHQGEQQQTQGLHHKAGASEAHPSSQRTPVQPRRCVRRAASRSCRCRYFAVKGAQCASSARWRRTGATRGNCCVPRVSTVRRCLEKRPRAAESKVLPNSVPTATKADASSGNDVVVVPYMIHGFPRRRRMHAPGFRHVCCTHHQAFQSLSVQNASKS